MDFKKKGNSTLAIENNKIVGIIKPMASYNKEDPNKKWRRFSFYNGWLFK